MSAKVWLVTGCSTGFGRHLSELVLAKGDKLVATARDPGKLDFLSGDDVLKCKLDVTDQSQIDAAVAAAVERFGRIDVLANNAGYGVMGGIEEVVMDDLRRQMEVNFFGAVMVLRGVLPVMRKQRSGHVLNVSSVAGLTSGATFGFYAATKFALEAVSEAVAAETAPLGIQVTLIEPGPFRTDFHGRSLDLSGERIADYAETVGAGVTRIKGFDGAQDGDPRRAVELMWQVTRLDDPPLRLPMGSKAIDRIYEKLDHVRADVQRFEASGRSADAPAGDTGPPVPLSGAVR